MQKKVLKKFNNILKRNKKNFQNSIYYFGGSIILLFFSQPIYARYLSAEDFGILGYYGSVKGIFIPVFLFGMTQYYLMNYFRQNDKGNKVLLFNVLASLTIFNLLVSGFGFFCLQFGFDKFDITLALLARSESFSPIPVNNIVFRS